MWEFISFMAGMVVLMLLIAVLPHVFDLPDAVAKYFSRKTQPGGAGPWSGEAAASLLGGALRRAGVSPNAVAQVTAAFWAADDRDRRALAHLVDAMSAGGPVDEGALLGALHGLGRAADAPPARDGAPPTTGVTGAPGGRG
jgi:hypothetical protein